MCVLALPLVSQCSEALFSPAVSAERGLPAASAAPKVSGMAAESFARRALDRKVAGRWSTSGLPLWLHKVPSRVMSTQAQGAWAFRGDVEDVSKRFSFWTATVEFHIQFRLIQRSFATKALEPVGYL